MPLGAKSVGASSRRTKLQVSGRKFRNINRTSHCSWTGWRCKYPQLPCPSYWCHLYSQYGSCLLCGRSKAELSIDEGNDIGPSEATPWTHSIWWWKLGDCNQCIWEPCEVSPGALLLFGCAPFVFHFIASTDGWRQKLHDSLLTYFKGKLGEDHVKEYKYNISTKDGKSLSGASNWGLVVKNGTVLVMSMVLVVHLAQDKGKDRVQRNTCPHCYKTLLGVMEDEGWLQW